MARPKKKAVKKKVAKRIIKKAPKPADHDLTPNPTHIIMNRMLDVVEANTIQVKTSLVIMAQMQQAMIMILEQVSAKPRKGKTKKPDLPPAVPDSTQDIPPNVSPEAPPEELPHNTRPGLNISILTVGFAKMCEKIGLEKSNEYLRGHNGCKKIEALEKEYWEMFANGAKDFVQDCLTQKTDGGLKPPTEVKITLVDLRQALGKVDKIKGRKKAEEILYYYFPRDAENKTVGNLKESDHADLIERCNKVCAA